MATILRERTVGKFTVLRPNGRIDSQSSPAFEAAIGEMLNTRRQVVLDFADVPYISSAGMRVVLVAAKQVARSEGKFALAAMRPEVFELFKVSGLSNILKIFDTPEAASAALEAV
jgi:anti-anti-sigma factor